MNKVPWQENNLIYKFTKGEWAGIRIEEIKEPWDLFLESCFLQTNFGDAFHVTAVKDKLEVILSIRDKNREPLADIITMPYKAKRYDAYWPKVRVFKTSHPMTIDERQLIVLDVIGKDERRAGKKCLQLATTFFLGHNGAFGNEHPNGLTIPDGKGLKRWKKIWRGEKHHNLCISSTTAYINETQGQAYTLTEAIDRLVYGKYDEIYFNSSDPWMERVLEHLKVNPPDRPSLTFRFFGDHTKTMRYMDEVKQWKEK